MAHPSITLDPLSSSIRATTGSTDTYSKCLNTYPNLGNANNDRKFEALAGSSLDERQLNVVQSANAYSAGVVTVKDARGPPAVITDPTQFVITIDTGNAVGDKAAQFKWNAICTFDALTYEVASKSTSHLYSTALCISYGPIVVTPTDTGTPFDFRIPFATKLTFKVDPKTCGVDAVRVIWRFDNPTGVPATEFAGTGYLASPSFPRVVQQYW